MSTFQAYSDFTAQGPNVRALMSLYALLENEDEKGIRIELTPFVVFLAFSIESYLNSLGARHLPIWDEIERLRWKDKVTILYKTAGYKPDWGNEPLQFAAEVFKIRDKLAHGKPERVLGPVIDDANPVEINPLELQPEWYRKITKDWVLQAKERFRNLMTHLGNMFGEHESDHLMTATGGVIVDGSIGLLD